MTEQEYDKEQLRILRNAFKAFDNDEKGYIEHSDVVTILEILGQKLDDKAVKALIKEVDKGTSGKLDFNQFCKLAARFVEVEEDTTNLAHELKEAFRVYDKEGKGYLTVQTLRDILHELDDKLSSQDLDMIIEEIDADGSGTVDFDEFMQVMTGKDFYDSLVEHRFVFESTHNQSLTTTPTLTRAPLTIPIPTLTSTSSPKCHCPVNRMRLHRRIEWHFERLFQQLCHYPTEIYIGHSRRARSSLQIIPHVPSASFHAIRSVFEQPKKPVDIKTCYRSVFRPRFPKWVPILTLYREIVTNPLKRRGSYMITRHE